LEGALKEYAANVLEVQKRRFDATGQLTSVSEDNIDQAPYFLYNTVYSNGNSGQPLLMKINLIHNSAVSARKQHSAGAIFTPIMPMLKKCLMR
jgi:hypothetical protein